jgi:lactate racemase
MNVKRIRILTKAWYGEEEMELTFPATWDVHESLMAGHDTPPMSDEGIAESVQKPHGTKRLRELAHGKRQVVIMFDDVARPSSPARVIPPLLGELHEAGIQDRQIRFVAAYGTHTPMRREDFLRKLGEDTVARFPIYSHNPYENLVNIGKTSRGIPILINREVMECDLKIGVGTLTSHSGAGFSGGAKIIFPGVAGMDSIFKHHVDFPPDPAKLSSQNKKSSEVEGNPFRKDIEEAATMAGLDFNIDVVVNNRREIINVFAGDFIAQHRAGAEYAKRIYASPIIKECDIVVSNAYPMENQGMRSAWPGRACLREGGIFVIVLQSVGGQILHYIQDRFGTNYGGQLWRMPPEKPLQNAGRIVICSSHMGRTELDEWGSPDQALLCRTWEEVLGQLTAAYPEKAKVAVYPYAPIQIPEGA